MCTKSVSRLLPLVSKFATNHDLLYCKTDIIVVRGLGRLFDNFKGNKSMKILIHCSCFRKLSRSILFNFGKVAEQ